MPSEKALALVLRTTDWSETSRIATLWTLENKHFSGCPYFKGTFQGTFQVGVGKVLPMARQSKPWYRVSKNTWYCTLEGRKVSLGVHGEGKEKEALVAWHRLMALGKQEKQKPKVEATVKEVIAAFLADAGGRMKPKTVEWYAEFLMPFAKRFGGVKASALTARQAEEWANKPTWSDSTRFGFLGVLVTAFKWAEREGLTAINPLRHVKKPAKASRGDKALISAADHARLLQAASSYFRPFLVVLHATGARPGEVAGITAANLDADAGLVRLKEHKQSHKGKRRVLYLTPEAVAILRPLKVKHGEGTLLRTRMGNRWEQDILVHAMADLRQRAAVPHATLYGYRHTFATDALANGVPDAQVAELLGHNGTGMLHKHYAHLGARAKTMRDALGKVR